jgi:hypothetical protein
MNLKSEELVKALRCCAEGECKDCAMHEDKQRCQENLLDKAAEAIERDQKEIDELREKQRWIPVTERLPEERELVNVVWVNRVPEPYYEKIKGVPFSGTACFFGGRWYWDSPIVLDLLSEYGKDDPDLVDDAVDITHWMPLPEPPKEVE